MLISDANVIKNDLTTVEKKVRRERGTQGGRGGRESCSHVLIFSSITLTG